jgi:N-formylglutamate amidohydrolase
MIETEMSHLVIHVPHASTHVPADVRSQFLISDELLAAEAEISADLWTDALAANAWPDAVHVIAPISRIVIDVERYADDAHEPMARVGRGMIYRNASDGSLIRRDLSDAERASLQSTYYEPHWAQLREAAAGRVLIDLHSYPREPWVIELDADAGRPEIVLGTDPALTPADWQSAVFDHFQAAGYEVGLNRPYGGVIDAGAAAAIMLELRRDMLGDGPGSAEWLQLVATLQALPIDP